MATLVAVVGDLHANSTVALCPPVVQLDDAGQYRASKVQRWVWRQWRAFWEEVGEKRVAIGGPLVIVLNGELADDNHHATTQIITRNPADMLKLAAETLKPALELAPQHVYVTRGTEAHSGISAHLDEAIARDIQADPQDAEAEIYSHWRLRLEVDGVRIKVQHHPPGGGGRVPWTRGNFANRLAAMEVFEAATKGDKAAHLSIFGHVHRPDDSYDKYPTRAMVLPSWQLTTAFGHRIAGDALPVGGAWFVCDRGKVEVVKRFSDWPIEGYRKL